MNNPASSREIAASGRPGKSAFCAVLGSIALLAPGFAGAAAWDVDPIRIDLSREQQTAMVTVKNDAFQATSIQIQAVAWTQIDGKDVYTPTRELLVSPPIVTIAAKSEQVIRIALRRAADATNELTYRINLQELPTQPAPGFTGVQVALRIGLPVFVQPEKGEAKAKLLWSIVRLPNHQLKVELQNRGNAHVQVSDFALYLAGNEHPIASQAGSSYVLAGQSREWLLKTGSQEIISGGQLRLKAYTDAGDTETEVVLGQP